MLYNIQVFDYDWTYKATLSPKLIKNELQFDWNVNGWQGSLTISLNLPLDNDDFQIWDMLKVFSFPEQNKAGVLLYVWWIKDISREANTASEQITLSCQWLWRLFVRKLFRWPLNQLNRQAVDEPADIIKDMIDQINAEFPWGWVSYSGWFVQNYWTSITIDLERTSCFDALDTIQEITQRDFYIRPDGQFVFRPTPTTPTHILTYKKDVERLSVRETSDDLVNRLIFLWSWVDAVYNDPTSQWEYGLFEFVEEDSKVWDQPTVDLTAENIVNERKNPLREISVTVNNQYDFTTINPWDTVAITNINYSIQNGKVIKVSMRDGRMELWIERYVGLWKTILSLVNGG